MKKFLATALALCSLLSTFSVATAVRFDSAIQDATSPIQQHLEGAGFAGAQ